MAVSIQVRAVESIDQKAGVINLNCWLRMRWKDPRLAYGRLANEMAAEMQRQRYQ